MNYYIQYHNADKLGNYPTFGTNFKTSIDLLDLDDSMSYDSGFYSRKKQVEKAIGGFCFLIVGKTEKIKKYYLWSFNKIESFTKDDKGIYHVNGTGFDFKKPILLNELEGFSDFKNFCGNFGLGFQNIDNNIFCKTLVSFSSNRNFDGSNEVKKNTEENLQLILQQLNRKMLKTKAEKRHSEMERILRKDKEIVNLLKKIANYKCQFPSCDSKVLTKEGINYVEVAHIKPVHEGGQSIIGNLIVLCPNHHKEFDYGLLSIDIQSENILTGTLNGKVFSIKTNYRLL